MKYVKTIICLFAAVYFSNVSAQFGVRAKYLSNDLDPFIDNVTMDHSMEFGLDYWFRLKDRRIEFLPELSYEMTKGETNNLDVVDVSFNSFNLLLNTNIYFMDFYNDCDCPTFSKDGNAFTKGFHLILSPGLRYYGYSYSDSSLDRNFGLILAGGIGMDIGINDLVTITPHFLYRYNPSVKANFPEPILMSESSHTLRQFNFGIRIGFRPDYETPRFGR